MAVTAPPYAIAVWHLDLTAVLAEPAAGDWRFVTLEGETWPRLALSETDDNGNNVEEIFGLILPGDRLLVQRVANALTYSVVDLGTPIDHGSWWELPLLDVLQAVPDPPAVDYAFIFRHAVSLVPPIVDVDGSGGLVPDAVYDDLVEAVIVALVAEVKADPVRDADKLIRAAKSGIDDVQTHIDHDGGLYGTPVYPSVAAVNARVFDAIVVCAASYLKRPGFAYGVTGYDEVDPLAVRARGAALAGITTGHKERFGVG